MLPCLFPLMNIFAIWPTKSPTSQWRFLRGLLEGFFWISYQQLRLLTTDSKGFLKVSTDYLERLGFFLKFVCRFNFIKALTEFYCDLCLHYIAMTIVKSSHEPFFATVFTFIKKYMYKKLSKNALHNQSINI